MGGVFVFTGRLLKEQAACKPLGLVLRWEIGGGQCGSQICGSGRAVNFYPFAVQIDIDFGLGIHFFDGTGHAAGAAAASQVGDEKFHGRPFWYR